MKNTMKRLLCLLLALCMCAGLALGAAAENEEPDNSGGGGSVTDPPEQPKEPVPEKIQISSKGKKDTIYIGETMQLTASIYPDTYEGSIIWRSSEPTTASVDSDGLVTGCGAGAVTITATVEGYDDIFDYFSFTVKEDTVTGFSIEGDGLVKVSDSKYTLKISGTGSFTLTGITRYESGREPTEGADWGSPSNLDVITGHDGTFTVVGTGTAEITATCPEDTSRTVTIAVEVSAPSTSLTITRNGANISKATMAIGDTLKLTATKQPENSFDTSAIVWSSSKTSVATVSSDGTVTAVANGTATITASCNEGNTKASVTVTVTPPSTDVSASVTRGKELSFSGIHSDLLKVYRACYGKDPVSGTEMKITSLGSASVGTLYTSAGNAVLKNSTHKLSAVKSFYFIPSAIGSYKLGYSFTADGSTYSGTITIEVTGSKTKDITIRLKDDSAYTFSSPATTDKISAFDTIKEAISYASGGTYTYIVFDTGSISSTSKNVGTLYPASTGSKTLGEYRSYTYGSSVTTQQSPVSKLYFEPKKEGTYKIAYTAFDSSDELCSGNLIIEVGVTSDATVTVTLDDSSHGYSFSTSTKKDKISAAAAINDAIKEEAGTYSYIKFGSVVSGSGVGELYSNDSKTDIKNTQYKYSGSSGYTVSGLYFVPEKPGTYVRSFTAYNSSGTELLLGTLKIIVPGDGEGEMDIYFNTTTGGSVSMSENVFESWYRQQKGTNYKLAYVTFDAGGRGFGSFKSGSSAFTPGNDVKYYTRGYTGSTGTSPKYLDKVSFTAPSYTGYVSVDFTCYGGTSASTSGTRASGTFYIFVTKGSIKSVTYDAKYGSAVNLNEGDFASVYKNAMSLSSGASTRYRIELLEIPSKGTLYYNYTSASKPGTKLTGSNFDDYEFYVNAASTYDSVSDLTYVPANSSSGAVTVRYLAKSASGESMYIGSVSFNYGKGQGMSVSCRSEGYAFEASDFYSSGDADPVAYVCFTQPESGELMLSYANGHGLPLDSSVRLYTANRSNGSYPLSSLSYIPKAGFSGNVEINYTAVTESGKIQNGVMTVAVTSRKGSAHFRDVQSTGSGAWASDAIDFAYKWGLVNGTGEDTFSPDDTMTRAMLVTILYRSAGSPSVSGSCPFTDVAPGTYYYYPVLWAVKNGIVTGTSPTTFSPAQNVNREQVAAFLHRYARYNGENVTVTGSLSGYSDKNFVSQYAIEPMSWAVQHGYITSASGEELLLSPGGSATRAQVAVMLHRFLTY